MQVYGERRRALMASDLSPQMVEYAERTVDDILDVSHPTSLTCFAGCPNSAAALVYTKSSNQ